MLLAHTLETDRPLQLALLLFDETRWKLFLFQQLFSKVYLTTSNGAFYMPNWSLFSVFLTIPAAFHHGPDSLAWAGSASG